MFVSFVVAMVVTMALIPVLMRASGRFGMLDRPEPRKVHTAAVPRVGGLAMLAGVLASMAAVQSFSRPVLGILAGVLVVAAEGAWDDRRPLGYVEKFAAQFLAAICVVMVGGLQIREIVLLDELLLPAWVAIPLTVVVIVALTNAINLADGLDGLAGGVSFFCCAALAVFAYASANTAALLLATALCGVILGFLRFNTHPAVVFMGDGGSQLLGIAIASLAILVTQSETSVIGTTTPLFLLAVPVLDTTFVIVTRLRQGRSPFSADKNHLHHRLLALGFGHGQAVTLIYSVQALLFVLAYFLRFESDLTNLLVFAALGAVLLTAVAGRWAPLVANFGRSAPPQGRSPVGFAEIAEVTHRVASITLRVALGAYCVLGAVTLTVPTDVALLLAGLLIAILILWPKPIASRLPLVEKGIVYIFAATLAYLFVSAGDWGPQLRLFETSIVAAIALSTAATLRFSGDQAFRFNTMDLLVLFTAIVIPNLPGAIWGDTNLAGLAARLVVLLYALETVLSRDRTSTNYVPRVTATLSIGVLAFKGLASLPIAVNM